MFKGLRRLHLQGAPSSRLLLERSLLESNMVQVPVTEEADTPATVVVFTGGLGQGAQDLFGAYMAPVWRIDDGRKFSSFLLAFCHKSKGFLSQV